MESHILPTFFQIAVAFGLGILIGFGFYGLTSLPLIRSKIKRKITSFYFRAGIVTMLMTVVFILVGAYVTRMVTSNGWSGSLLEFSDKFIICYMSAATSCQLLLHYLSFREVTQGLSKQLKLPGF